MVSPVGVAGSAGSRPATNPDDGRHPWRRALSVSRDTMRPARGAVNGPYAPTAGLW